MPITRGKDPSPGTLNIGLIIFLSLIPKMSIIFVYDKSSQAIKKGRREGTTPCAQRVIPSLHACKFSLENETSPIKNNTNIIDSKLSFKDINIKLGLISFLFINLVYEKNGKVWA